MRRQAQVVTILLASPLVFAYFADLRGAHAEMAQPSRKSGASGPLPYRSWAVPPDVNHGVNATRADWLRLGWQTFIALNWPAAAPDPSGIRGQPDATMRIGATSGNRAMIPTVWLTYRTARSTMLANGADPGPWQSAPLSNPRGCRALPPNMPLTSGFRPLVLNMWSKLAVPIDNAEEPVGNPLIDQSGWHVLYDIRINQSEYTYIRANGYYDAARQSAAFPSSGPSTFIKFPKTGQEPMFKPPLPLHAQFGALEVKAAWRVLDPKQPSHQRYYRQAGYFIQPDGSCQGPALFGLIGFHVLRLTPSSPSTWFWATFEHVDNVAVPEGSSILPTLAKPGTPNGKCGPEYNQPAPVVTGNVPWNSGNVPVDVCRVVELAPDVVAANARWQKLLAGTVWANYQMIDVIHPAPTGGPAHPVQFSSAIASTNTLSNTALETYVQGPGKSCMSCHAYGFPQNAPRTADNQVFSFLLTNADSSNPAVPRQKLPPEVLNQLRLKHQSR